MSALTGKWLVTGAGGMLGRDLCAVLADRPHTALTRAELDITDPDAVRAAVAGHDVVLNAAGWTDVDGAESAEQAATAVNGGGAANLAAACAASGAVLVHVGTDAVFGGDAVTPYPEDAPTGPVNAYGRGKLMGERAVLATGGYVVRTAWLYGRYGRNFVTTMLRLAADRDTVDVVDDQWGQPTWSFALARRLVELATAAREGNAPPGAYHGTASGETTWYGLARAVFDLAGLDPDRIRPTGRDMFPRAARQGAYTVLGHDRWAHAGLAPMAHWHKMLAAAFPVLTLPRGDPLIRPAAAPGAIGPPNRAQARERGPLPNHAT